MTAKIVNIIGKSAGPDELWMEYLEANNGVDQERMAFDIDGLTVQLSDGAACRLPLHGLGATAWAAESK